MGDIEHLRAAVMVALKNLEQIEKQEGPEQKERIRQEGERFLNTAMEIWHYYRERYELSKPPPAFLAKAKEVWELKEQGLSPKEICKRAKVNGVTYLNMITEWPKWRGKE